MKMGTKRGRKAGKKKGPAAEDRRLVRIILAVAVIVNFIFLLPLLEGWCLVAGDATYHYASAQAVVFREGAGNGLFGNWNNLWAMGFPDFKYYQYLAHYLLVMLHFLFLKLVPILVLEKLLIIIAVTLFPLSMYYGLRKLRLAPLPSAFASMFAFTLSSSVGHGGYGFSMISHGLFTLVLAAFLFPIALGRVYITISERRSFFLAVLLLSSVLLIQPLVGYALGISCVLLLFEPRMLKSGRAFLRRLGILAAVFVLSFVVVAHFFVPLLSDDDYYGGAFYASTGSFYQGGAGRVLLDFVSGKSLDLYRVPFVFVTFLFFVGLLVSLKSKEKGSSFYFALTGLIVFLLVSFGRSFWGGLFDIIPGLKYLPVFRFMFAVQFFALIFVGIALAFFFTELRRRITSLNPRILLCALLLVLMLPVFAQVFVTNIALCRLVNNGYDDDSFAKTVRFMRDAPDGRFIARHELGFSDPYFEALLPVYTAHDSFSSWSMGTLDSMSFYYTTLFRLDRQSSYDLFNVKYALVPSDWKKPFDFFEQEFSAGNYTIYSIPTTGYFDLVDSSTAFVHESPPVSDTVRSFNRLWLNSRSFDSKDFIALLYGEEPENASVFENVIYETEDSLAASDLMRLFNSRDEQQYCGMVISENRSINQYVATVFTNRSCYLLFKMTYNPGWRAEMNGFETEVLHFSPSFMAVPVWEGISKVMFYYEPDESMFRWLMACAVLVLLGLLMFDLGSRKVPKTMKK